MSQPVRIRELERRLPDAGRIRAGRKVPMQGGKSRPEKLTTFRFTSKDQASIEQVAAIYGGTPGPWKDQKFGAGQWEVVTTASEIKVALPPDPLGNTPIYELWSGGGCQRRCNGEDCLVMQGGGPDGSEPVERPCLCSARGELQCKLTTRLSVLLPEVRFLGAWMIVTSSQYAARELPGMVDTIRFVEERGIQRAVLRLESRKEVVRGRTKEFCVPVLGQDASLNELAEGTQQIASLPGQVMRLSPPPGLGAGVPEDMADHLYQSGVLGGDVVDAEIVAEVEPQLGDVSGEVEQGSSGAAAPSPDPVLPEETGGPPVELVQLWMDGLSTHQRAKVLIRARELAAELTPDEMPPTTFAEIEIDLAAKLMEEWGHA